MHEETFLTDKRFNLLKQIVFFSFNFPIFKHFLFVIYFFFYFLFKLHQIESDRTISSLHQTIEKLTADNRRLRSLQTKDIRPLSTTDKVRKELLKLKDEHKNLRTKYLQIVDRNSALEDELKKCRYQIHLLEEKDLAESISS